MCCSEFAADATPKQTGEVAANWRTMETIETSVGLDRAFESGTENTHYGGRCVRCRSSRNVQPHHVVGLRDGGDNHPAGGLPLCGRRHGKLEAARRRQMD